MVSVAIVGGSGYTGGEMLRLLLRHPHAEVTQVTSESRAGRFVHSAHPNLRGATDLRFRSAGDLEPCDVAVLALPHGESSLRIGKIAQFADRVVDLAADFRLRRADDYERWYGGAHAAPEWLPRFVYGLAEMHRDDLRSARYASGVGCNATAVALALAPLARRGLIERVVADLKVGSSEGGADPSLATHHPERSGAVRSFAPTGHRHQAEICQELGSFELHMSVTAVEMVRGVLCTAHVFPREPLADRELWNIYREDYAAEPFVRIVRDRSGAYRLPEPKILSGTNFCDVGFACDPASDRVVVVSALDNLMKGAAGSALQAMNLMLGVDETAGLEFTGLHPV